MNTFRKSYSILLVTVHYGANFGSALQTYATVKIFSKLGGKVTTLNYIRRSATWPSYFRDALQSLPRFLRRLGFIPKKILNDYFLFGGFLKKYCNLTQRYTSLEQIKKNLPNADIYVTGSDQVWNSAYNDGIDQVYYWSFLPSGTRKISFSSSIGKEDLSSSEFEEVKEQLTSYSALSVREKSAKCLLEKMNFVDVEHLLDPTFLLSKEEWRNLIKKRLYRDEYVLIYIPYNITSKEIIYATAKKIASKYNLKIVTFSKDYRSEKSADKTFIFVSPEDFLSLMYYAKFVITNSFHGTAFSINLNKQFWVYEPTKFSTRILSILELVGLKSRLLNDVILDDKVESIINFNDVNVTLQAEREKAVSFLQRSI